MHGFLRCSLVIILVALVGCNATTETGSPVTPPAAGSTTLPASVTPTPTPLPSATATPTVAPTPTPEPLAAHFAIIGDLGEAGVIAETVANLVKSWAPDFIVTTGDNNFPNGEAATIDPNIGQYYHEFIYPYQGEYGAGAETNRFFPILGNHDWDAPGATPYFDYFTLPGNERYYRVVHAPVTLYVLNSMPGEPDGIEADSVQAAWLQAELATSTTCWNLVFFHHTAYTSGHRGSSEWMRWPFPTWGADVTFSGHNHVYERVMIDGFPYITNGLAGAPRYAFAETIITGSEVQYNLEHGAMLVDVIDGQMTLQFVTISGEVVDTYTIEKACP